MLSEAYVDENGAHHHYHKPRHYRSDRVSHVMPFNNAPRTSPSDLKPDLHASPRSLSPSTDRLLIAFERRFRGQPG